MIPTRTPPQPVGAVTLPKTLLVEGDTPMHFCEALLRELQLADQIEIRNFRGVGDFKTYLSNLVQTSEFQSLVRSVGVVRDAENKPASAARKSIEDAFAAVGLNAQRNPPIRTNVYILPDNNSTGMLETLCMSAVRAEAALANEISCVDEYFTCLTKKGVALPATPIIAKNHAQVYLASRQDPQLFPGTAAYRGHWRFANSAFDGLKNFLRSL